MSDANYKNHPVRSILKQILDLQTDEEISAAMPSLGEDQRWQLERVFEVARVIEAILARTPSTLALIPYLSNLQTGLNSALGELNNFRSNKNPGHLASASAQVDQNVIPQLVGFATNTASGPADGLGQIVDDIRARSHDAISAVESSRAALEQRITKLTTDITGQDQRVADLTTAVEAQKKEAVAVTAEVRGEYAVTAKELRTGFDAALAAMKEEFRVFQKATADESTTRLEELSRKEDEAKKIVQVVGNIGVTGNYQKIALAEGVAANTWRYITIGFFGVGVAVALTSFAIHIISPSSPENVWTFAIRFVTAIAIASPAFYTARESARHRTNADRARQRELELASLGPFIELLPTEMKDGIRSKLVERYFGNDVEAHDIQAPIDPKDVIGLVKTAVEGLAKAAKS